MSHYARSIVDITGCNPEEAAGVEDAMRHDIFCSTLDWQTPEQFQRGAKEAYALYKARLAPPFKGQTPPMTRDQMLNRLDKIEAQRKTLKEKDEELSAKIAALDHDLTLVRAQDWDLINEHDDLTLKLEEEVPK